MDSEQEEVSLLSEELSFSINACGAVFHDLSMLTSLSRERSSRRPLTPVCSWVAMMAQLIARKSPGVVLVFNWRHSRTRTKCLLSYVG